MNNNLVKFLNTNKEEIFSYFKENSTFFPSCCVDIALILKHFIKEYFNEDFAIIEAKKVFYPNRKKFHVWLQKDDEIIDFSLFQFYIGVNKFKTVSSADAYQYSIEEIQRGDVVFSRVYYDKLFKDTEEANFEWFLNQYRKSLWDFSVDKELSDVSSMRKYFNECKEYL